MDGIREAWKEMRERRMIGGKEIEREREKRRRRNRSRVQGQDKERNERKPETEYKKVDRGLRTHFGRLPVTSDSHTCCTYYLLEERSHLCHGTFFFYYFPEAGSSTRRS